MQRFLSRFGLFASLCLFSTPSFAFQTQTTAPQSGRKVVRWAKMPILIQIHKDGGKGVTFEQFEAAIRQAFRTWAEPKCNNLDYTYQRGTTTSFAGNSTTPNDPTGPKDRDNISMIRFETSQWQESEALIARKAVVFEPKTGQLKEADLLLNGFHFQWSTDLKPNTVDVQTVLLQQAGFMLGLWFSEVPGAMMHASTNIQRTRRTLGEDDKEGSCFLYPVEGWKDQPPPTPKEPAPEPAPEPPPAQDAGPTPPENGASPSPHPETAPPPQQGGCQCHSKSQTHQDVWLWLVCLGFFFLPTFSRRNSS